MDPSRTYGAFADNQSGVASLPKGGGELDTVADQLSEIIRRVYELSDLLHNTADRLYGPRPEQVAGSGTTAVDNSAALPKLHERLETLAAAISGAQEQAERLQNIA